MQRKRASRSPGRRSRFLPAQSCPARFFSGRTRFVLLDVGVASARISVVAVVVEEQRSQPRQAQTKLLVIVEVEVLVGVEFGIADGEGSGWQVLSGGLAVGVPDDPEDVLVLKVLAGFRPRR